MHDDHPHSHDHHPDRDGPLSDYQLMEIAVRELLVEKRILTADEIRRTVEAMDARSPALGARVVARAWADPAFKARLLANGTAACEELGVAMSGVQTGCRGEHAGAAQPGRAALCAPAIRARCWGCRPTGTRAGPTVPAPCASRAQCCANSGPNSPTT